MSPTRKLWTYLGALLALLLAAELAARIFEPGWAAVSDRVEFKATLFDRQGPTAVLLIGTSRLNDGVRARQLGGFNASVPSSSLATQARLFSRGLGHPGLKTVVLEVSPEQVRTLDAPAPEPASPSRLFTHRRALALENLPRVVGLLAPTRFDGSEWFRDRWLTQALRGEHEPALALSPRPVAPGPDTPEWEEVTRGYLALSAEASRAGVELVFVLPPAAPEGRSAQCEGSFAALAPMLTARTGRAVLDYSCAALPDALFIDRTHLGPAGRAAFTRALAAALKADAL